jgi:adenylate cyclase
MATTQTIRRQVLSSVVLSNFAGAVLTFLYFQLLDPAAREGGARIERGDLVFFVCASAVIFASCYAASRWARPALRFDGTPPAGREGDALRRRALLIPGFFALLSLAGWTMASLLFGVLWPLLSDSFAFVRSLRVVFGILLVSGVTVAALVYFRTERLWRAHLPRFFPDGILSVVQVPRLSVRARMLIVLLLITLLPLAVLAVAALTRARALLGADPATAEDIIRNLILVVSLLAAAGLLVSLRLASSLATSFSGPLGELRSAMRRVEDGALDARCTVVSNDEIGAFTEGFNRMVAGLREREVIRETFGKYISPEVRDEILAGRVPLAGSLREVSILFADLRDFTPWVESTDPTQVVTDLNAYFTEMDAAIRANGGLVLQFIGDEIEAVFGAPVEDPRHADAALRAALDMRVRLQAWNGGRRAAGKPVLRHGIGIHTGTVLAGNIGSSARLSYALVGDAVNLASRIQSLNKDLGTDILISDATRRRLEGSYTLTAFPAVRVKGRSSEVEVFAAQAAA